MSNSVPIAIGKTLKDEWYGPITLVLDDSINSIKCISKEIGRAGLTDLGQVPNGS